ncbi:MAG TPA: hypothetical protein VHD32_06840 [Candidatus Didemnitutus sp.]|nr:hypothetical protein [Candidatus Didemnitutus sp.]
MKSAQKFSVWLCTLCLALTLSGVAFADDGAPAAAPATEQKNAANANVIVSSQPMKLVVEGGQGVHGQLVVPPEITHTENGGELVYTITEDPVFGMVGLAGGEDADFFRNKTAHLGYFAYRPKDGYIGDDGFAYTVRNETTGVVFQNKVVIDVKSPPPLILDNFVVKAAAELSARPVEVTTRPNTMVTQKLPSHEDFMTPEARAAVTNAKVAYVLDDKAKPQNGSAKLDRVSGQLTYEPNPGFIGKDEFKYYTFDENNTALGVGNVITIDVEPIRDLKHITVDRSKSREVDLVFVINNSPSMAPHQARIAENLRRFRQLFDEHKLDYRIGVLTTDFVNADSDHYKKVKGVDLDRAGRPVLDRDGQPKKVTKHVASNGELVTLPELDQPWVTPDTPDSVFAELVKVGTNGDSNRTAFTAVYNFVAGFYNKQHTFLRPDATTFVVYFMDEEETRMAVWKDQPNGSPPKAEWIENGKLPDLLKEYNESNSEKRQTLDGYINYWVLRPFIIVKGNRRGQIEMDAVVSPANISHRRAAELTGGTVLNIESDFSGPLAALGDRIADTVAVALDPVGPGATFYRKSLKVLVDGQEIAADPENGYIYDERTHSVRFQGLAKKKAFTAKIDITYEEHR